MPILPTLFEIRGKVRQQTGKILRPVRLLEITAPEPIPVFNDGLINGEGGELTLAYQGVDQLLMESRIQFYQRPPTNLKATPPCGRSPFPPMAPRF
jgi:hypothetical protein